MSEDNGTRATITAPKWMTMMVVATVIAQALVGILLIVTYANTGKTAKVLAEYQACVADYNQQFSTIYKARSEAAVQTDKVLDKVIKAVDDQDAKAFRRAVDNYLEARERQDRNRVQNPTPPLPISFCGPVPGKG